MHECFFFSMLTLIKLNFLCPTLVLLKLDSHGRVYLLLLKLES